MNKTEKTAFRESIIVVLMGLVINFPLQTFLLWLTIDIWDWKNTLMISTTALRIKQRQQEAEV